MKYRLSYIVYWLWNYATWPPSHLGRKSHETIFMENKMKFLWERSAKQAAEDAGISIEELKNKLESGEAYLEISIVIPSQEKKTNEDSGIQDR